jgi:hypothetical protein
MATERKFRGEKPGERCKGQGMGFPLSIRLLILTPWSRVLLEKLIVTQLVKKLPAFYGTPRIITLCTEAHFNS